MNFFKDDEDFSRYDEEELLNISLTYLIDREDLLTVNTVNSCSADYWTVIKLLSIFRLLWKESQPFYPMTFIVLWRCLLLTATARSNSLSCLLWKCFYRVKVRSIRTMPTVCDNGYHLIFCLFTWVILLDIHLGWRSEPAFFAFRIHNGIHCSCGRLYIELCRLKCDGESQSPRHYRETTVQSVKAPEEDRQNVSD